MSSKGDRVAIWAPNSAEWIIAAFGLLTAGGVLVPVNTRFKTEEAGDIIARSGAKAVLVQKGFLGQDYTAPAGIPVIDLKSDFLSGGSPFERAVSGTDISDIIFTSGTTGRPKGAMMNHRQTLRMYEEWATLADLREGDRYLQINPYFHTFGLKAGLITSFLRGATMLPVAVFDVDTVVDLIERERITMLPGPPTLYHSLLTVRDKAKLSTLRAGVTGAADIPVELVRRIHDELPFQTLMTGYGLTEAGNVTLSLPGDSFEDVATTAGVPCAGVEVRIADDGEVLVRGYGVMQGYLDDPGATAAGDRYRRLAAHRRSGKLHRHRAPAHRRPQEGHVHRGWLQRLPGRDRGFPAEPSGRRAGGRDRCSRRATRAGGQGICGGENTGVRG